MSLAVKKNAKGPLFSVSSKMGCWIRSCKPKTGFSELEIFAAFFMILGMALMLLPLLVGAGHKDVGLFASLAVLSMLVGGGLLLFGFLTKKHTVHQYEGGLVREVGGKTLEFPWQDIKSGALVESCFSPGILSVTVSGTGKEKIEFDSKYQGDAEEIINCLKANVVDVEYTFLD